MKKYENSDKRDILIEVALLKYKMDLSQIEIAKRLNISTMQVSRLLEKARQSGIIKIEVDTGVSTDSVLEAKIKEQYDLKSVIVVKTSKASDPIDDLARAAAMYIDLIVVPDSVFGIAGGKTIMRIIPHLKLPLIKHDNDIEVVQLTGGLLSTTVGNPLISLHEFTSRFNARGYFLNTPIYVPQAMVSNYLDTGNFAKINELWNRCTVCLGSVGAVGKDFLFYEEGSISAEQMEEVERKGAVGNVFGRWLDEKGDYIDCELNNMVISIPPDILKTIPDRIFVSGSYERRKAAKAILQKKIYNVCVITDAMAADLV